MLAEQRKRDAATMSSITFRGSKSAVRDEKVTQCTQILFYALQIYLWYIKIDSSKVA